MSTRWRQSGHPVDRRWLAIAADDGVLGPLLHIVRGDLSSARGV
jgi:hypothetical protein